MRTRRRGRSRRRKEAIEPFSRAGQWTVRPSENINEQGTAAQEEEHREERQEEEREGEESQQGEGEEGQQEEEIAGPQEARRPRPGRDPGQPTRREREEHEVTHLPYRPWCQHCVRGKAKSSQHRRSENTADRQVPVVAMDYTFFKTYEQEKQTPILVVKDTKYKAHFAYCVPRKGLRPDKSIVSIFES